MKKYNSITIALILMGVLFSSCALAESGEPFPDEEWNGTYFVGTAYDTQWMEHTSDGGYIIIGSVNYFSHGNPISKEYYVLKTSAKGDEQWSRKFREEDEDRSGYGMQTCIMQTTDTGYLMAGSTENFTTGSLNIWIRKLDAEGMEQWKKDFKEDRPSRQFFGGNNIMDRYDESDRSVMETSDGGFLILGKTNHCRNCTIEKERPMDVWLMKIDQKGNEKWNRTPGRTDQTAYSFITTPDGGFVLAGVSDTTWFIKSDQNGNELWNRTYEGIGGRSVVIRQASDGGYAAAITDLSGSQVRLIKTDPEGLKQWEKTYGDSSFNDFERTEDGGFLLWRSAWADTMLLKVDPDGNEQWRRNMNDFIVSYVEETKEGNYLLAATKLSDDVILGYTIEKLNSRGNKLWEKIFGNELSGAFSAKRKTIAQNDNGFAITGRSTTSYAIILKKFKNRDIPFAVFTYDPEYPGVNQAVTFDASVSNDPNGNILNYIWDFGDGNTTATTGKKITHSYDRVGEVTVRLTVMNQSGGGNSTLKKVFVQKIMAPDETMNVTIGNFSGAKYAQEISDRGFIIAGGNNSIYEGWLVKTDPGGKEEWNRTFRGIELKSVIRTQDGGFMAGGEHMSDIRLIKIDKTGKEEWNKLFKRKGIAPYLSFGIVFGENGTIAQTHDGGYVIAGINRSVDTDFKTLYEAWLFKTDPHGNEEWSRILRGNEIGQNILSSVQETSDGGCIVTGTWWNPYGGSDPFVRLMKTDQKGNEKWDWTRIISGNDHAGPGLQTSDGGFVMMGTSSYLNQSGWDFHTGPEWNTDIWLMKTDAKGNEQWRKSNRVKSLAFEASLSMTEDGGYVYSAIVQERPENDYENADIYSVKFVKLDSSGNIEWQKRDEGYSIKPTSDGGYVTARGSSLIKLGWIKPELSSGGIIPDQASANLNKTPIPPISSPENAAGFEAFLAITILLAVYSAGRKRK